MSPTTPPGDDALTPELVVLLEAACDRFEAAWQAGGRPALEDHLVAMPEAGRAALFRELMTLELAYRRRSGERPESEEYRARYPAWVAAVDAAFATEFDQVDRPAPAPDPETTTNPDHPGAGSSQPLPTGTCVRYFGDYEIHAELGRGGMGVVYRARQVSLNKLVALKLIRSGLLASEDELRRFQTEAEALALLDHPGIVPIYELGEHDGQRYFSMKLVQGGNLADRLASYRADPKGAAELLAEAAEAVHHAHMRGILHRDLKPANILVDDQGHPHITDFGLAKRVEADAEMTASGAILGTPPYMAPEQALGRRGAVTTATDVHGLGAVLYALLTGRAPFVGDSVVDTLTQVKEQPPEPPRKINAKVPRDLEIICLKCLEKDPQRRYSSAQALADDVRAWLEDRPIRAGRTPLWERGAKWVRRRPALAVALAISAAAMALLLGGGAYYNARLRQEAAKALAAQATAVAQRNLALNAFNQLVFDLQERMGNNEATRAARRLLLDTAIAGLDAIARGNEGLAPDFSRAVAHQRLGAIYLQIGHTTKARQQLDSARSLAENLPAQAPHELAVAECLRDALAGLGAVSVHDRQYEQARELLHRVVALSERIVQRQPDREGARRGLIEAYLELGRAHGFNGERTAAEGCYRRMHDLAEDWVQVEPANLLARDLLATSYRKLADERKLVGDYPAARAYYESAIAIGRNSLASDPGNFVFKRCLAMASDDLAGVAQHQGRILEARALFEESQRLFTEQAAVDPDDLESQSRLMLVESRAARLERDELQFARAAELFRQAARRGQQLGSQVEGGISWRKGQGIYWLKAEIAACELAPKALADPGFALTRPPAEACLLLMIRVRALAGEGRESDALEAAGALCDLAVNGAADLYLQAQALSACVCQLDDGRWTGTPAPEREALRKRCADRAIATLTLAAQRGFEDVDPSPLQDILSPLRAHPGYQKLANRLRGPGHTGTAAQ
jgi:serine/threonine-protein kinase